MRDDMPVAKEAPKAARSGQAAGVAGLLFSTLLTTSLVLFSRIPALSAGQDLTEWFQDEASATISIVCLYLVPFAGIAFLWFMAVLRDQAGSREDRFFDTVLLGSGLVFVALLFAGAAAFGSTIAGTSVDIDYSVTEDTILFSQSLGFALFNIYAARAAGVFAMVSSSLILRTGFLPKWMAFLGIVIALVLLLGTSYFQFIIYLFPLWVALISVAILVVLGRPVDS